LGGGTLGLLFRLNLVLQEPGDATGSTDAITLGLLQIRGRGCPRLEPFALALGFGVRARLFAFTSLLRAKGLCARPVVLGARVCRGSGAIRDALFFELPQGTERVLPAHSESVN
jgi:hypothetical protein